MGGCGCVYLYELGECMAGDLEIHVSEYRFD